MSHPFFKIDELLRLVIDELVETGRRSAVSFALTCRSFEEPTLSSLWKEQTSFLHLSMVLRGCTCLVNDYGYTVVVGGRVFPAHHIQYQLSQKTRQNHSAADWARFQRYASWMRGLDIGPDGAPTTDTLLRISCNSSGGPLFPKLEWIYWDAYEADPVIPFFDIFLSPNLRRVTISTDPVLCNLPQGQVVALARIISDLPISLEDLFVKWDQGRESLLGDAISSFVCQRGPSLRGFGTRTPLSEAAIHHLTQLPNLSHWVAFQGLPRVVSTNIFPSLEKLRLDTDEALPWLHLLASHEKSILPKGPASTTSHTNTGGTLKFLDCPRNTTIDSTLLSSIVRFRNLVTLRVRTAYCYGADSCTFRIADDDVRDLVTALPHLNDLRLGRPCCSDTCNTTFASLVSISLHCPDLTALEIHFNTRRIVRDVQRLFNGGAERDEAKCKLRSLSVGSIPLEVCKEDTQTIVLGLKTIFPYLTDLDGYDGSWPMVMLKMKDRRRYC